MSVKQSGQLAYEAYRKRMDGKSLATGQPIPGWAALPEAIRLAWSAAEFAVRPVTKGRSVERKLWRNGCGANSD